MSYRAIIVSAFLVTANGSIPNARFRPQFTVRPPGDTPSDLSRPIVTWRNGSSDLLVDVSSVGHFYVEDAGGIRVMDVHPAEGQHLRLHLPESRPLFLRKADESEEFSVVGIRQTTLSSLSSKPMQIARKGALHLAFEKLFHVPFNAREVKRFEAQYSAPRGPVLTQPATAENDRSARKTGGRVALWTAGISAAAGLGMTLWAVERRETGEDANQERRLELNRTIGRLNTAAVVFYSLSGAAVATWLTLKLWPENEPQAGRLTLVPAAGPDGFALGLNGTFDF